MKRRIVEVMPSLLEDEPMLGHFIRRELEEHGSIELGRSAVQIGPAGVVAKTVIDERVEPNDHWKAALELIRDDAGKGDIWDRCGPIAERALKGEELEP